MTDLGLKANELPFVYKFDVVAFGLVKNPMLRQHIERVGLMIYGRNSEE